jgi:hypothetical protein
MGDGLDLQRVRHDHPRNMRFECPHHRHCVAGCLDDDFVLLVQPAPKSFKTRSGHVDPPGGAELARVPKYYLRKGAVDVHANHAFHQVLPYCRFEPEQWATRQLRIRALGATGLVAGAASY